MTYAANMEPGYISARGRALAILILVGIQMAMLAIGAVAWWAAAAALDGGEFATGMVAALGVATTTGFFNGLLYLAAFVLFMTWVYRSMANLPALGSMSSRFTPSGAVWSYFIPLVNLVRGYQVMATIWTESQPALMSEQGYLLARKTTLVNWWWGLYILSAFTSGILNVMSKNASSLRTAMMGLAFMHVVDLALAIMFFLMIRATQKRQDAMWDDLERQRTVPQPTAQYLR